MIYQKRYSIIPDSEGFIQLNTQGIESVSNNLISIDSRKGSIINDTLSSTGSVRGEDDWLSTITSGGSSAVVGLSDANHPVGIQLRTGSNTNGAMFYSRIQGSFFNGQAAVLLVEIPIIVSTLSTDSNEYTVTAGFLDNLTTKDSTNGVYFLYDRLGIASPNNVNWHLVTAQGGTRTTTNTGVVVSTTTKHTLRLIINLAGTEVKAYINSTLVATITTNIPSTTSQPFNLGVGISKLAGTSSRSLQVYRITQTSVLGTTQ